MQLTFISHYLEAYTMILLCTHPSPTTTHLMACIAVSLCDYNIFVIQKEVGYPLGSLSMSRAKRQAQLKLIISQ
ncbi:CLUMA_CG011155, isoform A [Clunio marinus]|uniref:CLUMA_CG011155, isoform A n=1 Tax=Clunio marinus TaxID=568069 RepID=A0A1J1IC15_9DIPT|nr:CLUMA_CG011155, isoform A [Clunio marinus]